MSTIDTWVEDDDQSGFSVQNLPYGIFSAPEKDRRIGVAIGRYILDLKVLAEKGAFAALDIDKTTLEERTLNRYAALGQGVHRKVRAFLQSVLRADTSLGHILRDDAALKKEALVPRQTAQMHLPFDIGDYTDFFTSPYHAENCTDILRPGTRPPESMYNMPLGYHGRSSSVVVSGTPVRRPRGQFLVNGAPAFGPSQKLDFEVEFAAFIGEGNEHGTAIPVVEAEEHIFGVVLMNDWSARDIQSTEATPLGPFNGKNFCTTISPWVVPLDALEPLRTRPVPSHASLLPYLQEAREDTVYDIPVDVFLEHLLSISALLPLRLQPGKRMPISEREGGFSQISCPPRSVIRHPCQRATAMIVKWREFALLRVFNLESRDAERCNAAERNIDGLRSG
ncbi:hypothetical protein CLAIMM_07856 [Cladophialophora immunda]|nr:hypothetical protein CLAIMM_07856 [Cladophialophora immunda]